ncbi:3-oxoacyl-[acyl-carrier protein] reductase [Caldalkalibacillus uzonensis]|uniref:3-oxoacyl-[acyl-carrier protein] reductase n=1 Tax=Caldalkalibacillus uzonensis TaxID=353224 RepID=A0ABU0CV72_9BACI|nr:SDR family oxidoreductase [Caldalkalibacillus uzonensis]MDQ0340313.1 3-oxoacyl-[acyl-carrier protein] reductase [Caldalkalibacillus uzonensis]
MDLGYNGKAVLVTAASKGLGKASALALAKEGARVIISSRSEQALADAARDIEQQTGQKVITIPADVSQPEDVERLFQEVRKATTELFGLVCNAGGPPAGSFLSFADDDWQRAFETNLLSVVRLVRASVPLMETSGGRIITIASSSVKVPIPGLILSNTMRAGVQGLMKTLSIELAEKGILVNTVCPGRIATDRLQALDQAKAEREGKTLEQVQQESLQDIPLKRYGEPHEFGQLVAYLLSPANTYLTGSTYMVDGGMVKAL